MTNEVLKVEGMSCEHCVRAVTKAAKSVKGVKKVVVSLEAKTAAISYDEKKTAIEPVRAAIIEHGYEVR